MANNGNDASSEPKTVEKSSLTLYNLPVHVLDEVTGQLSLVDCLALRKVTRDLRRLVDSSNAHCETIEINFDDTNITMELDSLKLEYRDSEDGGCIVTSNREDIQKTKTYRDARNFKQAMIADASTFLSNPKLSIGRLEIHGIELEFGLFLNSLNHKLNVKALQGRDLRLLDLVQEFLKPETLEEIFYDQKFFRIPDFNVAAKIDSEILKNPKLKLKNLTFKDFSDARSAKFSKTLKSINSQLNIQTILVEKGGWIPKILQSFNPEKVDYLQIDVYMELTVDQFNALAERKEWKTKTKLHCSILPPEIGLEQLADFKEINSCFILTEENLIKIRDILLKSPHLDVLQLRNYVFGEMMNEIDERIERIMHKDPTYDPSTRRFSIPNSQDYFQLESGIADRDIELTIQRRVSPE